VIDRRTAFPTRRSEIKPYKLAKSMEIIGHGLSEPSGVLDGTPSRLWSAKFGPWSFFVFLSCRTEHRIVRTLVPTMLDRGMMDRRAGWIDSAAWEKIAGSADSALWPGLDREIVYSPLRAQDKYQTAEIVVSIGYA
jgi:hypothetical protein